MTRKIWLGPFFPTASSRLTLKLASGLVLRFVALLRTAMGDAGGALDDLRLSASSSRRRAGTDFVDSGIVVAPDTNNASLVWLSLTAQLGDAFSSAFDSALSSSVQEDLSAEYGDLAALLKLSATPSSSTSSDTDNSDDGSGSSGFSILPIAAGAGGGGFLILLVVVIVVVRRRNHQRHKTGQAGKGVGPYEEAIDPFVIVNPAYRPVSDEPAEGNHYQHLPDSDGRRHSNTSSIDLPVYAHLGENLTRSKKKAAAAGKNKVVPMANDKNSKPKSVKQILADADNYLVPVAKKSGDRTTTMKSTDSTDEGPLYSFPEPKDSTLPKGKTSGEGVAAAGAPAYELAAGAPAYELAAASGAAASASAGAYGVPVPSSVTSTTAEYGVPVKPSVQNEPKKAPTYSVPVKPSEAAAAKGAGGKAQNNNKKKANKAASKGPEVEYGVPQKPQVKVAKKKKQAEPTYEALPDPKAAAAAAAGMTYELLEDAVAAAAAIKAPAPLLLPAPRGAKSTVRNADQVHEQEEEEEQEEGTSKTDGARSDSKTPDPEA